MISYIKEYFLIGLYKKEDLNIFVEAKWITEQQKQEIISLKQ